MDDLSTGCLMHKFVYDTTLSEIIDKDAVSQMEICFLRCVRLVSAESNEH